MCIRFEENQNCIGSLNTRLNFLLFWKKSCYSNGQLKWRDRRAIDEQSLCPPVLFEPYLLLQITLDTSLYGAPIQR